MEDELAQIRHHLKRIGAHQARVSLDDDFEPEAGTLVKVTLGEDAAYWHLLPGEFLDLLEQLPDGAGADAVKTVIGEKANNVWEGPAPKDSRDRG